jgi:beta-lactamase superfamily II metal-dependent hydrolase
MKPLAVLVTVLVLGAAAALAAKTLDIYFIDVEGGQATLIVTPAGQSLLVDAGFATPDHRDQERIMAAARAAGINRLDYMLVTHFHADHAGGVPEIARRLPVKTFVDYGKPVETAPFAVEPFEAYKPVREGGQQLHPVPGDRLALAGVEADVVSAGGVSLTKALSGAGQANPACAAPGRLYSDSIENEQSLGIRLKFGRFTFLDLGDLSGSKLAALACPTNLVGHVDVYLVPHHGNKDTAIPAVIAAVSPRVAILNNGVSKGGDADAFASLRGAMGIEDTWQLHKTRRPGAQNFQDAFIANLNLADGEKDAGAWLKISADESGSFTVTNGRTGVTKSYQ